MYHMTQTIIVRLLEQKDPGLEIYTMTLYVVFCLCWGFTAQSTTRSCRAGQLIVVLFLGRLTGLQGH